MNQRCDRAECCTGSKERRKNCEKQPCEHQGERRCPSRDFLAALEDTMMEQVSTLQPVEDPAPEEVDLL